MIVGPLKRLAEQADHVVGEKLTVEQEGGLGIAFILMEKFLKLFQQLGEHAPVLVVWMGSSVQHARGGFEFLDLLPRTGRAAVPSSSMVSTAMVSAAKRPPAIAAVARACERSANSSCAARATPKRRATFSAVTPIGV